MRNGQPLRDLRPTGPPARPRDKAKVETAVLIAKRWIMAALRHRTFYRLAEVNSTIPKLLQRLNVPTAAQAPTIPPPALCALRSTQRSVIAREALRIRRVESRHRQHRLPHRGRQTLLQRAVSTVARKTRCASDRPIRWMRSKKASAWPPISEASCPITTPLSKSICRRRTRTISNGLPPESSAGPKKSARTQLRSSKRLSRPAPTPSKPTAPAWESCARRNTIPKSAWITPLCERLTSAPCPLKPFATSWSAALDRLEDKPESSTAALPDHENIRGSELLPLKKKNWRGKAKNDALGGSIINASNSVKG